MHRRRSHGLVIGGLLALGATSATAVDPNTLRLVKRPAGQVELTWQDTTPSSYCILRDVAQPPVATVAGTTALTYTDTPPTAMPLWNYGASESGACPPSSCAAVAMLTCESVRVSANNTDPGATTNVADYPGCSATILTGSEFVYTFQPQQDLDVDLTLSGLNADLDILVLDDGGVCDPSRCSATGDSAVSFRALAGTTYSVVVDGRAGAASDYDLDIACGGTVCTPTTSLACGALVSGNNGGPGATNVLRDYSPCALSGLTGPETVYTFTPVADGQVTFSLSGMTADLDLAILDDTGTGCLSTQCLQGGDNMVQVSVVAGRTYFVVVDGRMGDVSDYDLQVSCATAGCNPAASLVCGSPVFGQTDDPGSTDGIDSYSCSTANATGPEYTYTYTASGTGDVTFRLSGSTSPAVDVYVMAQAGGCSGAGCIAYGDAEATIPVVAGETYYVAIDGPAAAGYNLSPSCSFPPGVCTPVQPLRCGDILFGDTMSALATDVNDSYPCSPNNMSGRELTYEFAPPDRLADYLVSLTLLPQTQDLDVFALQNQGAGCDPNSCVGWGDSSLAFTAAASGQYFVAIDGRNGVTDGFQILVDCITAPGQCNPAEPIRCGDVLTGRSNGGPGSTDVIDAYPTCPPIVFDETGPEYTYRFDATSNQNVTVSLSNLAGGTAHLFVLDDMGSGCDVNSCVTKGTTLVNFAAQAGRTYYIVTDGFNGATATFDVSATCN